MSIDNPLFEDTILQLRRPKDYVPDAGGTLPHIESPNKVFIGSIPTFLSDDQVKELVQTFGAVKSFAIIKDGNGHSKARNGSLVLMI